MATVKPKLLGDQPGSTPVCRMSSRSFDEKENLKSNYIRSLDADVALRYEEKTKVIGGKDPYSIEERKWSANIDALPEVTYPDIVNYLVFTKSAYSLEDLKAYKSLDAYAQFSAGWVRNVKHFTFEKYIVISAKVLHSQKVKEKPLEPWVIAKENGTVSSAHCNCMAGLGEACTHIAAVLFYVEAAASIVKNKSVTDVAAYWPVPAWKDVPYARMCDIDFTPAKRVCREIKDNQKVDHKPESKKNTNNVPRQSRAEFLSFLEKLEGCGANSAILSIVPPFSKKFVPIRDKNKSLSLGSLFEEKNLSLGYEDLVSLGECLSLSVTKEEASEIEKNTKLQAKSKLWFKHRAGRITASQFKSVCSVKSATSSPSLVKVICYPTSKSFTTKATQWGCFHENIAKEKYINTQKTKHQAFSCGTSGFMINPKYPHVGATPDGIVLCRCCGKGCLEIKCPYCLKDTELEKSLPKVSSLIRNETGSLQLSINHEHYFQVQTQLFVSDLAYCDYYVWGPVGEIHLERVYPNRTFWLEQLEKATSFFKYAILPELLGKFFSRPTALKTLPHPFPTGSHYRWCTCKEDKGGKMIMCDKEKCDILWYHISCIGLKRIPKGKWFCVSCKSQDSV